MKNSAKQLGLAVSIAMLFVCAGRTCAGPVTSYWLTAGDQSKIYEVQGNSLVQTITTGTGLDREYPIAVGNTIRTYAGFPNSFGREYLPDGTLTGSTYTNTGSYFGVWDGATDGVAANYSLEQGTGTVVQYDRNWANGTTLFTVAGLTESGNWAGITFDTVTNSLWLNNRSNNAEFRNYSLTGTLLSSFTLAGQAAAWGLAYEQSSDSLWSLGTRSGPDWSIINVSKSGTLLSSTTIIGLQGNILGGEMRIGPPAAVPEPSAIALVFTALPMGLGFAWKRRRKAVAV
ncbi:PEP-CTERM protein-sorting domain-containing protein [Singulisphaera sp. GP187]|uniref:PEP-CTERM sorting domain-containing protein n=1 Tax=Singulisphaera sp. GP187 TaxID=1882752 RepID=UPI0009299FDC|nr:PEP-CTERM sorting domain-containing protein [Singulisphaera sp. GP187]SIN93512.1 PEP-CTERM protein-sorting domain-containing protein [Singulisphaera sp. GP187]